MEPPPPPRCLQPPPHVGSSASLTRRARKRIREAKKKARPELKTKEMWYEKKYFENFDLRWESVNDTVERIDVGGVSPEEFIEKYEKPFRPVAITGAMNEWQARHKWKLEVIMTYL